MSSIENISKKGEKNLLSDLFRDSDDESVHSAFSEENNLPDIDDLVLSDHANASDVTLSELVYTSKINKIPIHLVQDARKGIAHQLWPAAAFLCDYLESNWDMILRLAGKTESISVIELGGGIGLCGIFLARFGGERIDKTLITDLDVAMELIRQNIALNLPGDSRVVERVLRWGSFDDVRNALIECRLASDSPPLVIAADCVYWEILYEPFLSTLVALATEGCHIFIGHVRRWKKDSKFFQMCKKQNLIVNILQEVVDRDINENSRESTRRVTRIYHIHS